MGSDEDRRGSWPVCVASSLAASVVTGWFLAILWLAAGGYTVAPAFGLRLVEYSWVGPLFFGLPALLGLRLVGRTWPWQPLAGLAVLLMAYNLADGFGAVDRWPGAKETLTLVSSLGGGMVSAVYGANVLRGWWLSRAALRQA